MFAQSCFGKWFGRTKAQNPALNKLGLPRPLSSRYPALGLSFIFCLALPLLFVASAQAQDTARMDQIMQSYVGQNLFMGNVLIVKDGKPVFEKSYGSANLEWSIPNAPTTKFRLGSLTKQFTAASILLLEERGKLKLEDPVRKYLPDAPPAWQNISLFNLLTHTAGIPNYSGIKDILRKSLTPAELIATFQDKPLEFTPGQKWNYSNSNYVVLGAIIEKMSGESYAQFLRENIFDPLRMKDTGYDSASTIIPMRASGYARRNGQLLNDDFIDMSTPYAAGSLYSTTHDLLIWENALYGGKLLNPDSLKKMTTPFKEEYGFGLDIHDDDGHLRFAHNGGINGFSTALAWYPKDRLAIVVLDNVANSDANQMMIYLADISLERTAVLPNERKEIAVDAKTLDRYLGRYALRDGPVLEITRQDDRLFAQLGKQQKIEMFAEKAGRFFTKTVDSQLEFSAKGGGPASALVFHQGGRDVPAERLP